MPIHHFSHSNAMRPLKRMRVLIADPNTASRKALRLLVTSLGCETVIEANNANEVRAIAISQHPELILCEMQLDGRRTGQQLLEELHTDPTVPSSTIFILVSGEREYRQVVSAAEFSPDAYLIKPFSIEQAALRIQRGVERKQVLARAYKLLDSGRIEDAIDEAKRVAESLPRQSSTGYRLAIDLMLGAGQLNEAHRLLEQILASQPAPWARMRMAVLAFKQGRLDEAEATLEAVIAARREYLAAYDLLAQVKEARGQMPAALRVLEAATELSAANTDRLRRTGELAERTGETDKASHVYGQLIARVRDSSLARADDFAGFARVLARQGRSAEAAEVASLLSKTFRGQPGAEFMSLMIRLDSQILAEGYSEASHELLAAACHLLPAVQEDISPATRLQLAEHCAASNHVDEALVIAQTIIDEHHVEQRWRSRAQALCARFEVDDEETIVNDFTAINVLLDRIDGHGWDEAAVPLIQRGLKAPAREVSAEIAQNRIAAQKRLATLMRKYGISDPQAENDNKPMAPIKQIDTDYA